MQEKDILQGYEVGRWEFNPRIYKIIAASTVLALLPLFVLSQTNLLSASACESPFVNRVCQVLDTVYVGAKILAKDTGYVEKEYEDLQLKENNEVVWINETNIEPKLEYPTGYFEIANRDELAALAALNSGDPTSTYLNSPSIIPPANNNPIAPPSPRINPPLARNRSRSNDPVYPKRRSKIITGDDSDDLIGDMLADATERNGTRKPTPNRQSQTRIRRQRTTSKKTIRWIRKPPKKAIRLSQYEINKKAAL